MLHLVKSIVKQVASPLLDASGMLDRKIAGLYDVPGRFLVVMYHRVTTDVAQDPFELGMCVRKEHFGPQLDFLKERFNVLPLADAVRRTELGETLPPASLAITFDDGYLDNLELAAPMLLEREMPATFFVTTGGMQAGQALWWDRVIAAFADTTGHEIELPALGFDTPLPLCGSKRRDTVQRVLGALWALPPEHLPANLDALVDLLTPGTSYLDSKQARAPRMSPEQVMALRQMGFEIGAHTQRHVDMRHLPAADVVAELNPPREQLVDLISERVSGFAYPSGFHDASIRTQVQEAGFEYAVSTDRGVNDGQLRRYAIYRIGMPDSSVADFKRALCTVSVGVAGEGLSA